MEHSFEHYSIARNHAWLVLAECGVSTLPINLWDVAKYYNIGVQTYSDFKLLRFFSDEVKRGDGFSVEIDGKKYIVLNDKKGTFERRRFTFAHELGHCLQGHSLDEMQFRNDEQDDEKEIYEYEANIFARDLLMPAIVLAKLDIHTAEDIAALCEVSAQSAQIRAKRMAELYQRSEKFLAEKGYSCFGMDRRERMVENQFKDFIEQKKNQ